MNITLYATDAPAHDHTLYVAPRPLPGRQVGRCHGMVFDVAPEFEDRARELDGKLVNVVTEEEYERIVEDAVTADGHTLQELSEAGIDWTHEEIGFDYGLPLITITPDLW